MIQMPNKKKRIYRKIKKSVKRNGNHTKLKNGFNVAGPSTNFKSHFSFKKKQYSFADDEVPRLFSPFNSFDRFRSQYQTKSKPPTSSYSPTGLSSKEKSYIINSCQNHSSQYALTKSLAKGAILENKIFTIYGNSSCAPIRTALIERGWVEKIPPHRMNLRKIRDGTFSDKIEIHGELKKLLLSNLVEKFEANFIWRNKDEMDTTIDMSKDNNTMFNKLKLDALWTTKQGLCSTMKRNYWFYIENVAEVIGPRTYVSYDVGDLEGFVKDYKITACTSLLKWVLCMVANDKQIFDKTGSISMNVIVFALNRCKEYLFRKQHKDIDRSISSVTSGQWNAFLKRYYKIIGKDEVFKPDKEHKLHLYLSYAKFLLQEIHNFRPQLSCEGCHNIWIIKPAFCSRGRGIKLASKIDSIKTLMESNNSKYVVQKYIDQKMVYSKHLGIYITEEPLLIYDTKFDIRQYYVVTSTYPLVIWMYRDCYLKFSSQKYNLRNFHESIHLTNNAVQRKYKNCIGRHRDLPHNNMWDLDRYKAYLNKGDHAEVWDNVIYPGMKKSIIGIMLSCQDSMSFSKNRFELYGCDFILDTEYKPWIIEINACPDLTWTTQVTSKICPAVLTDLIKVVVDYAANPKASTGGFECVYRQPITAPRYYGADLIVRGYNLPSDYFYRGQAPVSETFDYISKQCDISAIIKRLKDFYDTDVVIDQYNDFNISVKEDVISDEESIEDANGLDKVAVKLPSEPVLNGSQKAEHDCEINSSVSQRKEGTYVLVKL